MKWCRSIVDAYRFGEKLILFIADYGGTLSAFEINTTSDGEFKQLRQTDLLNMPVFYPPTPTEPVGEQNTTSKFGTKLFIEIDFLVSGN